jgi:ATP-dependent Lon protease
MAKESIICPVLPLRDIVMFPGMIAPLFVGREKSVRALDSLPNDNKKILLVTQKNPSTEDPSKEDIYRVGVLATIIQLLKLPDGTVKVLVEAGPRMRIKKFVDTEDFFECEAEFITDTDSDAIQTEALARSIISQFEQYVKLENKINPDIIASLVDLKNPAQICDVICHHLNIKIPDKQKILEALDLPERLEYLLAAIEAEIRVLNTERKISARVKKQMEETQKRYYLNEKLQAIQKELGDNDDGKNEISELEEQIKKKKLSAEAKEKALSELKKLKMMNSMSAEAAITRNYLDCLLNLPWGSNKKIKTDIIKAEKVLNKDHYGLHKVKERIIEYLAVQQRTNKLKGPILCLVGPPGVGKTSLAKSIADATGRQFARISLGGVRDEAEIRGHRRTYIGAMPGKLIQALRKIKSNNPVILLDEIDKLGNDYRGDPASALLEVLDPEQNNKFVDHYLEVEYDLSNVMFIATSNSYNMPRPLLDRMEIIKLSGYTEDEKVQIAKRHLVQKQCENHGLKQGEWSISDEAMRDLIRYYTREAGVRNMEREIANLTRKAIREILQKKIKHIAVTARNLNKYAGVRKYTFGEAEENDMIGTTTGLAYTEVGGELLSIESVSIPGKGQIKTTGKLGDVMQESAQAAFSYFRSKSVEFGVTPPEFQKRDLHIHVPEGATPKDGPSAGIALFTSIVSLMTGIPVKKSVAMTGEITLRGRVLAIGGLKEKLLAALRGGIKTVLIPEENVKDLEEIPTNIKKGLEIIPVKTAEEVLKVALVTAPKPVEWVEIDNVVTISSEKKPGDIVTH